MAADSLSFTLPPLKNLPEMIWSILTSAFASCPSNAERMAFPPVNGMQART